MNRSVSQILFICCVVFFLIINLFFTIAPVDSSSIIGIILRTLIGSSALYLIILAFLYVITYIVRVCKNIK
jgi:hypothetical protein